MGTIPNLKQVQKRICEATGIGRTTVTELISKERSKGAGSNAFDSPTKKRKKSKPVTDVDEFDESVIRRTIHNFHNTEN